MKYINKKSEKSLQCAEKLRLKVEEYKKKYPTVTWQEFIKRIDKAYKITLYQGLWEEQEGICCYCGQKLPEPRIEVGRASVEHIEQKGLYPSKSLEYTNLLLSCMGKDFKQFEKDETVEDLAARTGIKAKKFTDQTDNLHANEGWTAYHTKAKYCNLKRAGDRTVIINPTDEYYNTPNTDCWRLFSYSFDGQKGETTIQGKEELAITTCNVLGLNDEILKRARGDVYETFENLAIYLDGDDTQRAKTPEERSVYFYEQIKLTYTFCAMHYSIISQNL